MQFDLFYELAVPGFAARSEPQVFHDTLAEIEAAEQHGFGAVWLVEHHFMREYSHASAPDLLLAAAAQRTQRLRLGHGIVPLPYHHPVHVAERLATLDILSSGRVEFGFGRGFSPREYRAFGAGMDESRERVAESLAILRRFFTGEPVSFAGRHYRVEDLDILPKVVQKPHPPLWMAAVSPESFDLAAAEGVGVLVGPFKPWFMVHADIERYRAAWRAHHGGASAREAGLNPRVGMTVGIVCLEDGKKAREAAKTGLTWFYRELLKQTAPVLERLHAGYEYYRRAGALRFLLEKTLSLAVLEAAGMAVAGDPEHCIRKLEPYRAAGVDHLLCAVGAGACPPALVAESLHTLGEHVIPHFRSETADERR
jgi:alkanesulfonate monooxygenase SsuD/methylene tetrahydromethanopterin reductase-like flavin-dependent oxidoreductase (luciferase family)